MLHYLKQNDNNPEWHMKTMCICDGNFCTYSRSVDNDYDLMKSFPVSFPPSLPLNPVFPSPFSPSPPHLLLPPSLTPPSLRTVLPHAFLYKMCTPTALIILRWLHKLMYLVAIVDDKNDMREVLCVRCFHTRSEKGPLAI